MMALLWTAVEDGGRGGRVQFSSLAVPMVSSGEGGAKEDRRPVGTMVLGRCIGKGDMEGARECEQHAVCSWSRRSLETRRPVVDDKEEVEQVELLRLLFEGGLLKYEDDDDDANDDDNEELWDALGERGRVGTGGLVGAEDRGEETVEDTEEEEGECEVMLRERRRPGLGEGAGEGYVGEEEEEEEE